MDGLGNGISKEAERSITASSMFPGFRFSPTDEELILYYLKKKLDGYDKCVEVIAELDICRYEPWDLPSKAIIKSDQEWFFFSPRGKKYPNGSQSKRATEIGYWKATGKERAVKSGSNIIGTKRTLVFHIGRAPKGERTEWIMHEYCVSGKGQDALVVCRLRRKCDYHAVDGANGRDTQSQSLDPSVLMASSGTYSGCDGELNNRMYPTRDKMAECSANRSSSSHDSHSVEKIDTSSQSDLKAKDETVLQPDQPTSHHVANESEDDLFAEILKDNIVQLDECLPPSSSTVGVQPVTVTNTSSEPINVMPLLNRNPPHHQSVGPRVHPSQGAANRRIRLKKLKISPRTEELEEGFGEIIVGSSKLKKFSNDSYQRRGWMRLLKNRCRLYVVLISVALVILIVAYAQLA
ncbi:unnamed protein product [Amaranthus hypochondriacus]